RACPRIAPDTHVPVPVSDTRQLRGSLRHTWLDFLVFANDVVERLPRGRSLRARVRARARCTGRNSGTGPRPARQRDGRAVHACYARWKRMPESTCSGRLIGRYALYDKIASGGMATVHLGCLHAPQGFSRPVAIKRMHPHLASDPSFAGMFLDEA